MAKTTVEKTVETNVVDSDTDSLQTMTRAIYYVTGVINVLLIFRLLFRAFGANPGSPIVQLIYVITAPILAPFRGIFPQAASGGFVFEPSILVAIFVYTLLSMGIVELLYITFGKKESDA